ncbi:MAG: hypothetical protein J5855_04030 [Mailhella sp.]|nr:hypothetical protein [Mailhella sp.]
MDDLDGTMNKGTCPVCGGPSLIGGFCEDCERKIDERFPNGEWKRMGIEDIRAALQGKSLAEGTPAPVSAAPDAPASKKRKKKSTATGSGTRSKTKKKAPSPLKRIIWGVILLALFAWLAPIEARKQLEYYNAPNKVETKAYLESYEWSWDSSKNEFCIDAVYRWNSNGFSGTMPDRQCNPPGYRSRSDRSGFTHKGSDKDPSEVRPTGHIDVKLYQNPKGRWRPAPEQGWFDIIAVLLGYTGLLAGGAWLVISGLLILIRKRRVQES